MDTKEVTVSAAVGKQVFDTSLAMSAAGNQKVDLRGFLLSPLSAKAQVVIRSGNASGDVKFTASAPSGQSIPVMLPKKVQFHRGMHVKVLGTGSTCYLYID